MSQYFYTGFDYKNRKNGYFKIGQTQNLASRLSNIRHYDNFQCLAYIEMPNCSDVEARYVESVVRLKLERDGMQAVQNDHFLYQINDDKYEQANAIANRAIQYAKEACRLENIEYKDGTRKFKRS